MLSQEVVDILKEYSSVTRKGPFIAEKNDRGVWSIVDSVSNLKIAELTNSFPLLQENHAKLICILLNNYRNIC